MTVQPFEVEIRQSTLDDLQARLASTRHVPHDEASDWDAGMNPAYLRRLVDYWALQYDWRAEEARINRFAHFRANVRGTTVHFIHERGKGDAPLPIVLTHGFPDSFLRFMKLIPLLTDPAANGADPRDAFHVVVPSLPGYAFSDRPAKTGTTFGVGSLWHKLMVDELGYERFGAHGGDWGSTVTEHLARSHSDAVLGIHLTDVPFWHAFQRPHDLRPAEEKFVSYNEQFTMHEGAYAMIQGTRPLTLADSLNDSPAGLAAWLVEKFQRWSDCDGDIEKRFTKDELLTNVMIYWATETIGSAFLPYYDLMQRRRLAVDLGEDEGMGGVVEGPGRVRAFSQGPFASAAGVGRALLQRAALDGDAERWPLRGHGGTRTTGRGHPSVLSPAPITEYLLHALSSADPTATPPPASVAPCHAERTQCFTARPADGA